MTSRRPAAPDAPRPRLRVVGMLRVAIALAGVLMTPIGLISYGLGLRVPDGPSAAATTLEREIAALPGLDAVDVHPRLTDGRRDDAFSVRVRPGVPAERLRPVATAIADLLRDGGVPGGRADPADRSRAHLQPVHAGAGTDRRGGRRRPGPVVGPGRPARRGRPQDGGRPGPPRSRGVVAAAGRRGSDGGRGLRPAARGAATGFRPGPLVDRHRAARRRPLDDPHLRSGRPPPAALRAMGSVARAVGRNEVVSVRWAVGRYEPHTLVVVIGSIGSGAGDAREVEAIAERCRAALDGAEVPFLVRVL